MDWLDRETKTRRLFKDCFDTEQGKEVLIKLVQDIMSLKLVQLLIRTYLHGKKVNAVSYSRF